MDRTCRLSAAIKFCFIYLQTNVIDCSLSKTVSDRLPVFVSDEKSFLPCMRQCVIRLLISCTCDRSSDRHRLWLTEYYSRLIPAFLLHHAALTFAIWSAIWRRPSSSRLIWAACSSGLSSYRKGEGKKNNKSVDIWSVQEILSGILLPARTFILATFSHC